MGFGKGRCSNYLSPLSISVNPWAERNATPSYFRARAIEIIQSWLPGTMKPPKTALDSSEAAGSAGDSDEEIFAFRPILTQIEWKARCRKSPRSWGTHFIYQHRFPPEAGPRFPPRGRMSSFPGGRAAGSGFWSGRAVKSSDLCRLARRTTGLMQNRSIDQIKLRSNLPVKRDSGQKGIFRLAFWKETQFFRYFLLLNNARTIFYLLGTPQTEVMSLR